MIDCPKNLACQHSGLSKVSEPQQIEQIAFLDMHRVCRKLQRSRCVCHAVAKILQQCLLMTSMNCLWSVAWTNVWCVFPVELCQVHARSLNGHCSVKLYWIEAMACSTSAFPGLWWNRTRQEALTVVNVAGSKWANSAIDKWNAVCQSRHARLDTSFGLETWKCQLCSGSSRRYLWHRWDPTGFLGGQWELRRRSQQCLLSCSLRLYVVIAL